jgi:hypothetical protein
VCVLTLFGLNVYVSLKLFGCEYTRSSRSTEGNFIAMSRLRMEHSGQLEWRPYWAARMPIQHTHSPLMPATVAAVGTQAGWTAALEGASEGAVRRALARTTGTVRLPAGIIEVPVELAIPRGAHDLEVTGDPAGTVLRATASFQGRAILSCRSAARIRFSRFTVDGNRASLERRAGLPPYVAFAGFYSNNGILVEQAAGLTIQDVSFRNVASFPILVAASKDVLIQRVVIEDSGSRNEKGKNNTTGGILLEEGTTDFRVEDCRIRNVRGNGIWTHSLYKSPRNQRGRIAGNQFENIGRDAIQVGHAVAVTVTDNTGKRIGYPAGEVDVENGGFPVAIDTAGNVERSFYSANHFEEIDGKCIDLDGFHHGEVRDNVCINRGRPEDYPFGNYGIVMNNANPDMKSEWITIADNEIDGTLYSGMLVIGSNHKIVRNRLRNLNLARCNDNRARCTWLLATEPEFLRSGIYLARGAARPDPARANRIEANEVSGYGIAQHCIVAAPGVSLAANTVVGNRCGVSSGK